MKRLKVFEAFSGYGSHSLQLQAMGIPHEVVGTSEIDIYAITAYSAVHENFADINGVSHEEMEEYLKSRNIGYDFQKEKFPNLPKKKIEQTYSATVGQKCYGDISLLKVEDLPDMDLFTFSFPCFIAGTLIMTDNGFKKIEEITDKDRVLTHTNKFQKVVKPMINRVNHIYRIRSMSSEDIFVTEEHPFYTRSRSRVWDNERRSYNRVFSEPKWTETKNLTKKDYLGVAINQESKLPKWEGSVFEWSDGRSSRKSNRLQEAFREYDFWWIIGRYIGDGWLRHQGGIIISTPRHETQDILDRLNNLGFNNSVSSERTVDKIHVSFKEIGEYCEQFGRGAENKRLTGDILNLPCDLLKGFLEGYMSADGCLVGKYYKATSVSRELIHGIGQCVAKVYKRPFSIGFTKRNPTCVIEGRTVNQLPSYNIAWKLETDIQDKAFYENGYIWCPISKIEKLDYDGFVYNMEVENDNSYTANGIIVHNCQDISVAGNQKGLSEDSGTRSSLLWECQKVIEGKKPTFTMMENVKNLVGKKHKHNFDKWLEWMDEIGYNNYWKVINAKNCGIPQNRERVFLVSIRKDVDDGSFKFEDDFDSGLRLKDFLEINVDEKYYIKNERANELLSVIKDGKQGSLPELDDVPLSSSALSSREHRSGGWKEDVGTLCARDYKDPKVIAESMVVASRGRYGEDGSIEQKLEPNKSGYTNTITTVQKDNLVLEPNEEILGGIYIHSSERFQSGLLKDVSRCLKAEKHDAGVVLKSNNELKLHTNLSGGKWDKVKDSLKRVYSEEGISPTIDTCQGGHREAKVAIKEATKQGYAIAEEGDSINVAFPNSTTRRGRVGKGVAQTLDTQCEQGVLDSSNGYRIRKLTPRECFRLMGLTDIEINRIQSSGISNSQQYKLAGNSIVKQCMTFLKNLPYENIGVALK